MSGQAWVPMSKRQPGRGERVQIQARAESPPASPDLAAIFVPSLGRRAALFVGVNGLWAAPAEVVAAWRPARVAAGALS